MRRLEAVAPAVARHGSRRREGDVVVVGGGISGLATALAIRIASQKHGGPGLRVVLVNDGVLGGDSATVQNGGTIHTGASYALGHQREAQWCRQTVGTVSAALPDDCVISRKSFYLVRRAQIDHYLRRLDELGLLHERCGPRDLSEMLRPEPAAGVAGVVIDELQADMSETVLRFTQACLDAGVDIVIDAPVREIVEDGRGGVSAVRLSCGTLVTAGRVLICAGPGTTGLLRTLNRRPRHVLAEIYDHHATHIVLAQGNVAYPVRGAEPGLPVVTQLRDYQSISLYGVPPQVETAKSIDQILTVFRSWFLPGALELDDIVAVTQVSKVEFHGPHMARSTLPRVLDGRDLGVAGLWCLIPGKLSHAIWLALAMPRSLGFDEVHPADVRERLDQVGPRAHELFGQPLRVHEIGGV